MPGCRRSDSLRRRVNADCGPVPRNPSNRLARRPGSAAAAKPRFLSAEILRFQPPVGSMGPRHPFGKATALSCSSIRVLLRKRSTRGRRAGHGPD
jgi:hypothetical protein